MARFFQALQFRVGAGWVPEWEFLEHTVTIKDPLDSYMILEYLICLDFWEMKGKCPVCKTEQLDLVDHYLIAHQGITHYEIGSDRECAVSALLQESKSKIIPNCWRCCDCGKVIFAVDPQECSCYKGYYSPFLRHLRCPICVQLIRVERFYSHYKYCWEEEYVDEGENLCRFCCSYGCNRQCGSILYNAMKYVANRMESVVVPCPICWQTENIANYKAHFLSCAKLKDVIEMGLMQIAEKWKLNYTTHSFNVAELGKVRDWTKPIAKRMRKQTFTFKQKFNCSVCPESFDKANSLLLHFFTHKSQPMLWEMLIERALVADARLAHILLTADVNQLNSLSLGQSIKIVEAPIVRDVKREQTPTLQIKFHGEPEIPKDTMTWARNEPVRFMPIPNQIAPRRLASDIPIAPRLLASDIPIAPRLLASDIPGDELEEL